MRSVGTTLLGLLLSQIMAATFAFAQATADSPRSLSGADLEPIADIVQAQIKAGEIPGAAVLIGNRGRVIYRRAFGYRALGPEKLPMKEDTVFDLASLTKVIATTTAVMQLAENGRLRLEDPISKYWPALGANGKESITVRQLLTHYSGLGPDLNLEQAWSGYSAALKKIVAQRPMFPPGSRFLYSDIDFEILGELVRRVSGQPLDAYCERHIFRPLGMNHTGFRPSPAERDRIAPTEYVEGKLRWGQVHDPTAYRMGGVAGHAGLFSNADDLAIFAQMLLDEGTYKGVRILRPRTVEEITAPKSPPTGTRLRGLGWDIGAPFASNRDELPAAGSYGHTGYTGTLIWIDPVSKTYVVVLTSRLYPDGKGDAEPLRIRIMALVSAALGPLSAKEVLAARPSLASYYESTNGNGKRLYDGKVATGADVLEREQFAPLRGKRVGLITNASGVDSAGKRLIDRMYKTPGVRLAAIFSPEHGLYGNLDEKVASGVEPATGLPLFSLYGDVERPTDRMLEGIDVLVFDVQDTGARFYTYATTMAYAMEAVAKKGIGFYVLDRPNPLSGAMVQGPVMDKDLKSFVGYFPMPVRHGMTVGELAEMFNVENKIGAKLHVIRMRGYKRGEWYDDTGLQWAVPSPNLRTLTEATLYPGVAMVEGANVSVGRGTETPFELLGAPWIDGTKLAAYLNHRRIQGVSFQPVDFTPNASSYKNQACHGIRIVLIDRQALDSPALGIEIADALYRLYPTEFQIDKTLEMIGSRRVLKAINDGEDPRSIERQWQVSLAEFRKLRARYLLY